MHSLQFSSLTLSREAGKMVSQVCTGDSNIKLRAGLVTLMTEEIYVLNSTVLEPGGFLLSIGYRKVEDEIP